jgi:hypothetical protein
MAIAKGFTTLMLRTETKKELFEVKKLIEKKIGVSITHSEAVNILCQAYCQTVRGGKHGTIKGATT